MSIGMKGYLGLQGFIVDYCQRHKQPTNAILHLIGVPMSLTGLYWLFTGRAAVGFSLCVLGYFLQYLGHRAQGNEVGEITLIKNIIRRMTSQ